jgi:hypothetical protein
LYAVPGFAVPEFADCILKENSDMRKSKSSVIDQESKRILRDALPPANWEVYDISPDIAKDHPVELIEEAELLGIIFYVQLKGTTRIRQEKDYILFDMKTKYLNLTAFCDQAASSSVHARRMCLAWRDVGAARMRRRWSRSTSWRRAF